MLVDRVTVGTERSLTEETRPQQDRPVVPAHDPNVDYPLHFTRGRHEVLLKLDGDTAESIAVRVDTPWRQLAEEKGWSALDRDDRLRTLSDKFGPFAELQLQRRAHELLSALRDLQQRFTTTLVAAELPTPRETRVLSRGEYNLPIGDPLEPDVLAVMGAVARGRPAQPARAGAVADLPRAPAGRPRAGQSHLAADVRCRAWCGPRRTSDCRAQQPPIRSCSTGWRSNCRTAAGT